jgi:uncharacterized delta-60 repeat protein
MAKRPLVQLLSSLFLLSTTTSLLAAPPPMRVEATFKQPDGNVLIAGKASSTDMPRKIVVARMTPTGQWDWGFGMMGSAEYPSFQAFENFHATSMTQYPDGKVLVAGRLDDKFALIRLDSFGNPDFSFGTGEPGMALLPFTDGFQANALYLQSDGGIIGFGSYQPPFGGGRQAAAVRYFFNGQIDWAFANQGSGVRTFPSIYGYETAFRALVPTANGVVVAGERREASSGRRKVIVAGFLADGSVDNAFGFNGWSQYEINMFGDESAESIRFDQLSGNYLIAGANGHMHNGPQNWLNAFAFNTMGQQQFWGPPGPEGNVPMPNLWQGNATAVVTEPLVENNDVLYGGTVIEMATGRSHFALWRAPSQGWSPTMWMPRASPVDADDDVMATAFPTPDGQQIIAVGTRETPQGDIAVRMRYFADTGEFDTVMSEETDNVPNPFSFEPFSMPYDPATYAYSAPVRISGINTQTEITAANGQFSLNCEGFNWTAGPEWISNGQKVCVRVLSATTPSTTTTVTLNVGGVQAGFDATTGYVPDTLILTKPTNPGTPNATFTYRGDMDSGGADSFECSLDGAAFAACPLNGITYPNLSLGSHTFQVRGSSAWGTDATPASYTWNVADLPQTTIASQPANYINVTNATVAFSSNDPAATFECQLNGSAYAPCTSPKTYTGLTVGAYTFNVRAKNAMGTDPTPATTWWIIDLTPPDTAISEGPVEGASYNVRSFEIRMTSPDSSAHYQYSLNGGPYVETSNPVYLTNLADGAYSFKGRAVDPHGNIDATPVSRSWRVDTVAPNTAIKSGPPSPTRQTTATFEFSASESAVSYECKLDTGTFQPCVSGITYTRLSRGTHQLQARAIDAAGNVDASPATWSWKVN